MGDVGATFSAQLLPGSGAWVAARPGGRAHLPPGEIPVDGSDMWYLAFLQHAHQTLPGQLSSYTGLLSRSWAGTQGILAQTFL